MVINRTYDIGQLVEQLQTEIEKSKKCSAVKLDILTANDILEVLKETHRREQKHQTLESALTFIEKDDGTQTNLMEEHNKKSESFAECFGKYYTNCKQCDNVDCDVRIDCISETKFREDIAKEQKTKQRRRTNI